MDKLLADSSFWIMTVPILFIVVIPIGIAIVAGTASLMRGEDAGEQEAPPPAEKKAPNP